LSRTSIHTPEVEAFSQALAKSGGELSTAFLSDDKFVVDPTAVYLSIVEFGASLFNGGLTETEFANLQVLAGASPPAIFWITTGDLLGKVEPNAAMVMGLGRSLQTEYPLLKFFTVDLDHKDAAKGAIQVIDLLEGFSKESDEVDKEYIVKGDIFHVSRLSDDAALDNEYTSILGSNPAEEKYNPEMSIRLDIERIGLLDTFYFKEDHRDLSLKPTEAEIQVKAIGLNMKV
jgi:hypothetical protein